MQLAASPPPWLAQAPAGAAWSNKKLLGNVLPDLEMGAHQWEDLPLILAEHLHRQLRQGAPGADLRRRLVGAMQRAAWARLSRRSESRYK